MFFLFFSCRKCTYCLWVFCRSKGEKTVFYAYLPNPTPTIYVHVKHFTFGQCIVYMVSYKRTDLDSDGQVVGGTLQCKRLRFASNSRHRLQVFSAMEGHWLIELPAFYDAITGVTGPTTELSSSSLSSIQ